MGTRALAAARPVPTLEDARRAADSVADLDPGMVLLFGSVARGDPHPGSDLDLCLVFDDLGDYSERRNLVADARRRIRDATGIPADVKVTDRAEWRKRSVGCKSSIERHIASHAVQLAGRPPARPIDYAKEIGMAPSDAAQAAGALTSTLKGLYSLNARLPADETEREARDPVRASRIRQARMLDICVLAQTVMETALKALIHALEGDHPDRTHDIGGLIGDAATAGLSGEQARKLREAMGPVTGKQASVWRETSTYLGDTYVPGNPEDATPRFATQMATAAVRVAQECARLVDLELGTETDNSACIKELAAEVLARIPRIDPS
ncbi:nucleotidyltransferase domain-containing protein [Candidatus Poriferisocius sp.]|uniref:nucleotidyltransferase domain-containing protein n=1 Tax=Candidatus Poriferisocius sp. TaxID=3101276 RepID=UPI003B021B1D